MYDASNAFTSQTNVLFAFQTHIEICLIIKHAGCVLRFKRKRKNPNAKIYEDKRDLYCTYHNVPIYCLHNVPRSQIHLKLKYIANPSSRDTPMSGHHVIRGRFLRTVSDLSPMSRQDEGTLVMWGHLSCGDTCHVGTPVMWGHLSCGDTCHVGTPVM